MKTTRKGTFVKGRELEAGMLVEMHIHTPGGFGSALQRVVVVEAVRAGDEVDKLRELIGKTKQRAKLAEAVDALKAALDALDFEGREARIVIGHTEEGERLLRRTAGSQEDFRYLGQRSVR